MKPCNQSLREQQISAFLSIHEDLKKIMEKAQCITCSCFYADVLNPVHDRIRRFQGEEPDPRVQAVQTDLESWFKRADPLAMHG